MTRERTKQLEPVLRAWAEGSKVQVRLVGGSNWDDYVGASPNFSHDGWEWRVKPEPRKIWVNQYVAAGFGSVCISQFDADREIANTTASLHKQHEFILQD